MRKSLTIRTVKTASGAKAIQIIRYTQGKRIVVSHIGSAHTGDEVNALYRKAELVREQLDGQLSIFPAEALPAGLMHMDHMQLSSVTHCFSYEALRRYSQRCGLDWLPSLYQDLVLSPHRNFNVSYGERTALKYL